MVSGEAFLGREVGGGGEAALATTLPHWGFRRWPCAGEVKLKIFFGEALRAEFPLSSMRPSWAILVIVCLTMTSLEVSVWLMIVCLAPAKLKMFHALLGSLCSWDVDCAIIV